ncbi:MAG: DUF2079 domain-containing protein [Candidatus Omnitrophica bacterium]|nr:DUF2079 domain-containing protein [Candidatus Omnitrophota bacterium]
MAKIICFIGFFFYLGLLLYKYYSLGYSDWDLAFFSQAMWNLCHGHTYVSLFEINFFSNHANLIALLLVPFYKIFPHPVTLLTLKLASFSVASYILYLLTKEKLGQKSALIVLCLYWLCPANIYSISYEFDFENLAPAFIMLTFYYYSKNRWMPFLISSIFLIIIKENMPLIIVAFGIHGWLTKSDKIRWGLVPTILGAVLFYGLAFIFVPLMGGHSLGQHPYSAHYSELNAGLWTHPLDSLRNILTKERLQWIFHLFQPLFLSLFSPSILFLGLPIILQHFLSSSWQEHTLRYGYMLSIMPFIFLAFTATLDNFKRRYSPGKSFLILLVFFVVNLAALAYQFNYIKFRYMESKHPATAPCAWQLLKKVPPQSSVVATFRFLPELSRRPELYSFHKIYDPAYQSETYSYSLPQNVNYALIDFNDPWLLGNLDEHKQFVSMKIRNFLAQGPWKAKYAAAGIVLYERQK